MTDQLRDSLFSVGLFPASAVVGYIVTHFLGRMKPRLAPGAHVRMRLSGGVARALLAACRPGELVFTSLLPYPKHGLPEIGESLLVEAAMPRGLILFRTRVKAIDKDPFMLVTEEPTRLHALERRAERRLRPKNLVAALDEAESIVRDISPGGSSLYTHREATLGERVLLTLPTGEAPAYVLECRKSGSRRLLRLCFESPLDVARLR